MTSNDERNDEQIFRPLREQQALEEVGRTEVSGAACWFLTLLFALTIGIVALIDRPREELESFVSGIGSARRTGAEQGWIAGNRAVLAAMDDFENRIEDDSLLRERLLPPVQLMLASSVGLGNEQAYLGNWGQLLFREDVDYVIGQPFLDPDVLIRRSRSGKVWEPPPVPDPVPAIEQLHRDLSERGIALLVMPVPVKPMIEPATLRMGPLYELPLQNPSWSELESRLHSSGIDTLDTSKWLAELASDTEEPLYLQTDTHWTPAAMGHVARRLADEIGERTPPWAKAPESFFQRRVVVEGSGDVLTMLRLPESQTLFAPQQIETAVVLTMDGRPWRSDPDAEVLLLGDSFTNVFSVATLGWGSGAGLAEQLSYVLQQPVDRIALNAGGASASRRALVEALAADPGRLEGKKIVVYQFAARELTGGDWPVLELPGN